jgi:CelD/BcsL family acetyltransferase involved in cellulose biosynthesis
MAMTAAGFACRESVWRETAMVDLTGSWDEYLAQRSAKFRSNLRRANSAATHCGEVTFERYRPLGLPEDDGEPRWAYFDECVELASRSWQAGSTTGTTISQPEVRGFFRELFGAAAQAGTLDINLLRQNGSLIAFTFNLVTDGRITGMRIGFDASAASLSPGRLLLAHSLEDSFRRRDRQIDLGSESMHFKQHWLTHTLPSMRYTHYPASSLRSQLLRAKHWLWASRHSTTSSSC